MKYVLATLHKISKFPDSPPPPPTYLDFSLTTQTIKNKHVRISMIIYLNNHGVHACICFK